MNRAYELDLIRTTSDTLRLLSLETMAIGYSDASRALYEIAGYFREETRRLESEDSNVIDLSAYRQRRIA